MPKKTVEVMVDPRDAVMARIAAALVSLESATNAAKLLLVHMVDPEDDRSGKKRKSLLEEIDEHCGLASRAVQTAQESFAEMDRDDLLAGEPDPDEDDEDEDDEDDDDESDD